jgi:hypothetical protein
MSSTAFVPSATTWNRHQIHRQPEMLTRAPVVTSAVGRQDQHIRAPRGNRSSSGHSPRVATHVSMS